MWSERLRDGTAEEITQCTADRHAEHEERQRAGPPCGWHEIAYPAGARRSDHCLANADPQARHHQHGVIGRDTREGGQRGPDKHAVCEQLFAAVTVSDAAEWHADKS